MTEPPSSPWGPTEGPPPDPEYPGAAWSNSYPTGGYPSSAPYPTTAPPPPRRGVIVAAGLGVAVVAFGLGFGVSALTHTSTAAPAPAVVASSSSSPLASAGMTPTTSASGPSTAKKAALPHLTGAVLTSGGATWTIKTKAGTTVSVIVDSTTVLGTKKTPAKVTDFPAGTKVVVQLARGADASATTVHAVRITKAAG